MPLDIAQTNSITIRKGDALWLTVDGVGGADVVDVFDLSVPGITNYASLDKPVAVRFDTAGKFIVNGTRRQKGSVTRTVEVTVADWSFGEEPAAWVGRSRLWTLPKVPEPALVESGAETSLQNTSNPG